MKQLIALTILCYVCAPLPIAAQTAPEGMELIQSGEFWMGRSHTLWRDGQDSVPRAKMDDRPANLVHIDSFYMDKYEVTNTDYASFVEATGTEPPWHWHGGNIREGLETQAVFNVNWYEAEAFCNAAGKRLPTEAEWEKAARGGLDRQPYPWGYKADYESGAFGGTGAHAVGAHPPNGYGLHDMAGNVLEWTNDWYDPTYYPFMPKVNPQGPENGLYKSTRGGGWTVGGRGGAGERASNFHRNFSDPELRGLTIGFRCAMSVN